MRVLVVGAGIGGLGAAIALHRAGHEPAVFEPAGALEAVGAGIALSANAMAACGRLGVAEELRRRGLVAKRACALPKRLALAQPARILASDLDERRIP